MVALKAAGIPSLLVSLEDATSLVTTARSFSRYPSTRICNVDEFIRVCTGHARPDETSYSERRGERVERDCIQVLVACVWEFNMGDGDVPLPMASRYYSGLSRGMELM